MFALDTDDKDLIFEIYGHTYTMDEIKTKYPFDDHKRFNRKRYAKHPDTRITYNPMVALQLKTKGFSNIVWGQKVSDNQNAFVFRCQDDQKRLINF